MKTSSMYPMVAALLMAVATAAPVAVSADPAVVGQQPPVVERPPVTRDGDDEHLRLEGVVEAVDPRAGAVRVDGRLHLVRFEDGYALDTRGNRVALNDLPGRRVSIDYLTPAGPGGHRVASHFFVLVEE